MFGYTTDKKTVTIGWSTPQIIVPSSTMENWRIELGKWCPSLKILNYYGQQDERRSMRLQVRRRFDFTLIQVRAFEF